MIPDPNKYTICIDQSIFGDNAPDGCFTQERQTYIDLKKILSECLLLDIEEIQKFEVHLSLTTKNSGWEVNELYIYEITIKDVTQFPSSIITL